MKVWPFLLLATLLVALLWINPVLTLIFGKLALILVGLIVGLFFGSYYARAGQVHHWSIRLHSQYIAKLLLERLR